MNSLYMEHKKLVVFSCSCFVRTSTQKQSAFIAPDAHSAYISQLYMYEHTSSRQGSRTYDKFIRLILEEKTETINNNKGAGPKQKQKQSLVQALGRTGRT